MSGRPPYRSLRYRRRRTLVGLLTACSLAFVAVTVDRALPGAHPVRTVRVATLGTTASSAASSKAAGPVRTTVSPPTTGPPPTTGGPTASEPTTAIPPATPTTIQPAISVASSDPPSGELATPAIEQYLRSRDGDVTAALDNLETGRISLWRPGVPEYTASIVKVDILATLLHQAQAAHRTLSSSQQELAETMIEQSDDDSATSLWDETGEQSGITGLNRLLGLTDTVAGIDGHWGGTTTTAADQVRLLQAVVLPNRVLTNASRDYELSLMENVEPGQNWGVSSGPVEGTTIALKNGWLPLEIDDWQVNSIGWIDGDGRDYLLAVLTKEDATEGYGIDTIQGLSSLVWDELRN